MDKLLTANEAYLAMIAYLEAYYQRTQADDIGALLGDLQLCKDGKPADPAATTDWQAAVEIALKMNPDHY